jgi:hypothetical protein
MLLSLVACVAPAAETAPSESKAVSSTEAATPSPTAEPTLEPTPTPEPELTEAEKMMDIWLVSAKAEKCDVYANLVATKAYLDGEFDDLIEEGKYTEEDIHTLIVSNNLFKDFYYPVTDAILSDDYNVDDLTAAELAIAILRGDNVKATPEQITDAYFAMNGVVNYDFSLVSALPETMREDVNKIIAAIDNCVNAKKDVTDLESIINSFDLDWRQKWCVIIYCTGWPGISPDVNYNGEVVKFGYFVGVNETLSQIPFDIEEILQENYLSDPNDILDIFGVKAMQ